MPDGSGYLAVNEYGNRAGAPITWTLDTSSDYCLISEVGVFQYDPASDEMMLGLAQGNTYYQRTDWPVQLAVKNEAEKIEDYCGLWEFRAYKDSKVNGLIDSKMSAYEASINISASGAILLMLNKNQTNEDGKKEIKMSQFSGVRIADGCLEIKMSDGSGNENFVKVDTYENGWIAFPFNFGTMFFEKTNEQIEPDQNEDDLNPAASEAAPVPETDTNRRVRINEGSNPNVRSKPGTDGKKVGTARSGKTYDLLDEKDGWYKIRLDDGAEGWISSGMAKIVTK